MIKYIPHILLLLTVLIVPASSAVVTSGGYVSSGAGQYGVAIATNSVTTLTVPAGTAGAQICVETAGIRYKDDGGVPTSSSGMPAVPSSSTIPVCFQYFGPLNKLQIIGISGSPTIDVSYYRTSGS
jgi:hypothetical protein